MLTNQPRFKYALLGFDTSVLLLTMALAFFLTDKKISTIHSQQFKCVLFCISTGLTAMLFCLMALLYNDLYKRNIVLNSHRQTVLIIKAMLASCAAVLLLDAMLCPESLITIGRLFIGLFFITGSALLLFYRLFLFSPFMKITARRKIFLRRLLIVGADTAGRQAATALIRDAYSGFQVLGFIDDYRPVGMEVPVGGNANDLLYNLGTLDDLKRIVEDQNIEEILVAIDSLGYDRLNRIVERCVETGKVLRIHSDFLKILADKMRIEFYADIPVIKLAKNKNDAFNWRVKRISDVVLASIGLVVFFPLFMAVAIGIRFSSPGPIFFTQKRIGKCGKAFKFYKFRSMHVSSDDSRHQQFVTDFIKNNQTRKENSTSINIGPFKIKDDPRIFKFGSLLRKTSLDEFPQLINVIKGEMSLVGPRPCLPYEWDCYDAWHKNRLEVLPGCTGLWQALGRSTVTFEEMVILDLYYINNISIWLDMKIILITIPVLFFGKGAY